LRPENLDPTVNGEKYSGWPESYCPHKAQDDAEKWKKNG